MDGLNGINGEPIGEVMGGMGTNFSSLKVTGILDDTGIIALGEKIESKLNAMPNGEIEYYSKDFFEDCHTFMGQSEGSSNEKVVQTRGKIEKALMDALERDGYYSQGKKFTAKYGMFGKVFLVTPTPIYADGRIDDVESTMLINFIGEDSKQKFVV